MTYFGFTRSSASSTIFKSFTPGLQLNSIYSPPPPPPDTTNLGTNKKVAVFGNRWYWESLYKTKKLYLGPGNRPRYSGGGGIGRGGNGGGGATVVIYDYIYQERSKN